MEPSFRKFPKIQKHPDFTDLEEGKYSNTVDWSFVHDHLQHYIVEEKLDGSNMGIACNSDGTPFLQTRGQKIDLGSMSIISDSYERNVREFEKWAWKNIDLIDKIPQGWMIYGEWLRFRHTVPYDSLPDWFIAFAVHDNNKFLMPNESRAFLQSIGFQIPPLISLVDLRVPTIRKACVRSAFSSGAAEGVVIKSIDDGTIIKWVCPEFRSAMQHGHWRRRKLEENRLTTAIPEHLKRV